MKLYLIRHGQTGYNASSLHQHENVELSKLGEKQAEILTKRFSKIPIDVIYSSPLKRAKDTAEIINKKLKKKVIYVDFLKEWKNPSEVIDKSISDPKVKKIHELTYKNRNDHFWHYSDEENFIEFRERVLEFFNVLEKTKKENILAVTHGGPIRIIIFSMMLGSNIDGDDFRKFKSTFRLNNTGITLCEKENGHWVVQTLNDHSHLG